MGLLELKVEPRLTQGKNANRRARAAGKTPAVLYGNTRETRAVQVDAAEFYKALDRLGGRSAIFALQDESAKEEAIALLRDVQRHPVTDEILHFDLFEIPRGQPVVVPVWIQIEGESPAVKKGEGVLEQALDSIEIRCLPREMPDTISVDVSELEVNDKIFVGDVVSPVGEIVSDPEQLIVTAKPPMIFIEPSEEEEEGEAVEGEEAEGEAAEGEGGEESAEGADDAGEKPSE